MSATGGGWTRSARPRVQAARWFISHTAQFGLVLAVARREDDLTRGLAPSDDDERFARESFTLLLGLPAESALVRILARRVLRRPWAAAPAPTARVSAIIVTVAVALGAVEGRLFDEGFDRFYRRRERVQPLYSGVPRLYSGEEATPLPTASFGGSFTPRRDGRARRATTNLRA